MGFGFLPLGASGAIMLITVPQLLAAAQAPEPTIAWVTTVGLAPSFLSFIAAPLLDWRFSRRAYAIVLAVIGALCSFAALLMIRNVAMLAALLFAGNMAISMMVAAVGGWFGNVVSTERKSVLGAWFTVANIGGGGLTATCAIFLLRDLPYAVGAGLLGLFVLAALPLFLWIDCPPADGRLASESFRDFARDVLVLLRQPTVLWTLPLFLLPSASFALTNTLGGLGHDFNISEKMVGLIGGAGVTAAGIFGSLMVPQISRRLPPRPLYLLVGIAGALFTLTMAASPHNPTTFTIAFIGENVFQAAAFSVLNVIILRTIGHDNPLAATQFGLLNAASCLPLIYMQTFDGQAYGLGGVTGSYLADAGLSGGACLLMALMLWTWRRRVPVI